MGPRPGTQLALAPPVPLPAGRCRPQVKTTRAAPRPASQRRAAALRSPARITRPLLVPRGTWLPISLLCIPGLLYAHDTTATAVSGPPECHKGHKT